MHQDFAKPTLSRTQKERIKKLYKRDNFHGFFSLSQDIFIIAISCYSASFISPYLLPLSILIIGSRQRSLASLLHEATHGTLFRTSILNRTVGRVLCGWTILQAFTRYRDSHVLCHHPRIGESIDDPDLRYMLAEGVYDKQNRSQFVFRFIVSPLFGGRTLKYLNFLFKDRLIGTFFAKENSKELFFVLIFHLSIACTCIYFNVLMQLALCWWLPFILIQPIIGWFSELSEHFPLMGTGTTAPTFSSRNRYAGLIERLFIGMHGDSYHLTHHLLPGIPHWNLEKATMILLEDDEFRAWDNLWGGIFSSNRNNRLSLFKYIIDFHRFEVADTCLLDSISAGREVTI